MADAADSLDASLIAQGYFQQDGGDPVCAGVAGVEQFLTKDIRVDFKVADGQ